MKLEDKQKLKEYIVKNEGLIISEGSLKLSDLLKASFNIIVAYNLSEDLKLDIKNVFQAKDDETVLYYNSYYDESDVDIDEEANYLWNEEIFHYFNELSPDGYYFGCSEGDGALFGWFKLDG